MEEEVEYHYSDNDEEEYNYSDDDGEEEEEKAKNTPSRHSCTPTTPPHTHSSSYLVLRREDIHKKQQQMIAEFQQMLNLPFHSTQRILMQYQWNEELLMNTFVDRGLDHILLYCGLKPASQAPTASTTSCLVCMEDFSSECEQLSNPFCGHAFCSMCWQGHCTAKVQEGKTKNILCCSCSAIVDPEILARVLAPQERERYELAMMDSYIEDNPTRAIWCPSKPNCGRAIVLHSFSSQKIDCECVCGEDVFCFHCKGCASHSPVPCEWAMEWQKKCESESENATFILANCKPCPKCKKPIQKGDGCNHVTCICGQYMCWLCGAATGLSHTYSSIEGHSCETYRASDQFKRGAEMKEKLDLYMHYFEKYEIHMQSLRKAKEKESEVNATMDALNARAGSQGETELADWLWIGLKQLFRMRRFVAWTYVLAYFSFYKENGQPRIATTTTQQQPKLDYQTLFETLQTKLQNSIEDLSLYVEMKPEKMDTATIKPKVLTLCHNTHQQASNLWNFVNNDMFNNILPGTQTGNAYFPIKRMVTGLGAKVIVDTQQQQPAVRLAKMEVEEDNDEVVYMGTSTAAKAAYSSPPQQQRQEKKKKRWMNLG